MIDPADAERVINRVATTLAHRYRWLTKDELVSEAWIACKSTEVLTKATSPGAFHERIKMKLIDSQKVEREWQEERIAPVEIADVSNDGTVYTYGEEGEKIAYGRIGGAPSDDLPKHVRGQRSRLLDRLASMTKDGFMEWGDKALGRQWSKKRDLRTLLYGYEDEIEAVWVKYATNKRKYGDGGIGGLSRVDREQPEETWRAYRRYPADRRAVNLIGPRPLRDRKPAWEKLRTSVR